MAVRECDCCQCCYLVEPYPPYHERLIDAYITGSSLLSDYYTEVISYATEYNYCCYNAYIDVVLEVTGGPCPVDVCCAALDESCFYNLGPDPYCWPAEWIIDGGDFGVQCDLEDPGSGVLEGGAKVDSSGGPFDSYEDAAADMQAAEDHLAASLPCHGESVCDPCQAPGAYCTCSFGVDWDSYSIEYENVYEADGYYYWEASGYVYATGEAGCMYCQCCDHFETSWCSGYITPLIEDWGPELPEIPCDDRAGDPGVDGRPPCYMRLQANPPSLYDCDEGNCFYLLSYEADMFTPFSNPSAIEVCNNPATYTRACDCCDEHPWHCIKRTRYQYAASDCTGEVIGEETLCSKHYRVGCNGEGELIEVLSGPYDSEEDCEEECAS